MSKAPALYACLYLREFPAQSLLRLRPDLHGRPCVVMQGELPAQHVCSLNTKARELGLHHGMTRVEVDTFSEPAVLSRSVKAEALTRDILLDCAGEFSPRLEDCSEDNVFLCGIDITGTQSLFGPPHVLAGCLLERVRSLRLSARVVVSSNFHTAACLAKEVTRGLPLRVIPTGDEAASLAALPLSVLNLTETQAETFSLWGIQTLGMLAALPEAALISRLGQESKRLHQLANGKFPHFFQPVEPVFRLEEQLELDSPIDSLDSVLFVVSVLLEQLMLRAKVRLLALASVAITMTLDGGGSHTRTIRPALPTMDKQLWIKLIQLDLEAHPAGASVLGINLQAEPGSTSKVQLGLFSPQLPETARLDVTLARIRAVVGEDNVGRAVLRDTHGPDAFRIEPFAVPLDEANALKLSPSRTTMRQLRPTETIAMIVANTRPASFLFHECRYHVERAYGPWIAGGEWWNKSLWGMEQWDLVARSQAGSMLCCCVARDFVTNCWQMAALYD